ncbi:CDC48 family AAA ATPase [Candidatus Woesearchaeota archaeon]|nr:CDC48 family AAA ATPase [Candidatus Woesearchaeota archaeon]
MSSEPEIKLKVVEAIQDDLYKGIIRIDTNYMHQIGVRPGDVVEIMGDRKTVGVVERAYPGDIGLNIIRMDGLMRRNAKTGIGEFVKIKKASFKLAKKVVIAPAKKGIVIKASPEIFKQGLLGRPVVKDDLISLGGPRRKRSFNDSPIFDDVFNMLDESLMSFGLGDLKFVVVDTTPKEAVVIDEETEVTFNPEAVELKEQKTMEVTYEDIGGLDEEVKKVREMVELPLKRPEIFERLGIEPPKGVLLHGPPGTGKTLLAKAVANETDSNFSLINGPEIMSKYYGQSEENLRKKFEDAEKNAPSIIFIDEIDAIASKREESKGEVERRVVAQLLALMDGLKTRGKVVVMAASNIPNALDPALRRPGRFDREIELGVPSKTGRRKVLQIHTRRMPLYSYDDSLVELRGEDPKLVSDDLAEFLYYLFRNNRDKTSFSVKIVEINLQKYLKDRPEKNKAASSFDEKEIKKILDRITHNKSVVALDEIASITHGFVGADLAALSKEAAMILLRRIQPELKLHEKEEEPIPQEILDKIKITQKDFIDALKVVRPSALREVLVEIPNVKWADIGGLENVHQELIEAVEWPLKNPQIFSRLGITPPKGVLLYGPPGTGKTLLAKAVANESEANFISVKGPEMLSKWVGESEKAVREIFNKARQASPTIIFFDELDAIAPRRGASSDSNVTARVVNQLLTEMDGLEALHDIVVIAATNRPDIVDTALLRPGRFDRIVLVGAPNEKARHQIFKVHTQNMKISKDVDIIDLSKKTEGYAGADIESVCREAAILALRDNINVKEVSDKYFDDALKKVRPSISKDVENIYESLKDQFSSAKAKEMKEEKPSYYG